MSASSRLSAASPECSPAQPMPGEPPTTYDATDSVVGLARTLRSAGVDAGPERVHALVLALRHLDPGRRDDVYWAGRLTLCAGADDIDRYNRVFAAYFGDRPRTLIRRHAVPAAQLRLVQAADAIDGPGTGDEEADDGTSVASTASRTEVLRHRDIASLSATDRAAMQRLLAAFRLRGDLRRSRRTRHAHRGRVDPHRTLRRRPPPPPPGGAKESRWRAGATCAPRPAGAAAAGGAARRRERFD